MSNAMKQFIQKLLMLVDIAVILFVAALLFTGKAHAAPAVEKSRSLISSFKSDNFTTKVYEIVYKTSSTLSPLRVCIFSITTSDTGTQVVSTNLQCTG